MADVKRNLAVENDSPMSDGDSSSGRPKTTSPWILNSWQDLLLFIGTPLLIVPLATWAQQQFSDVQISVFVIAFGAGGHHLPGMMRAYGDRALFQRFKVRFIVSPIFLLAVCMAFAQWDLNSLFVVLLLWGFWHGMMQVYGFVRIYDAKVGSFAQTTARLDWLMCLAWFGIGMLHSPVRMSQLLNTFYRAGGPLIPPVAVHTFQNIWTAATVLITLAFLANHVWLWRQGRSPSFVKVLTMASSFAFWWYAMVSINNILIGIALFEIFHDVQYLAIVWVFNRIRVEKDPRVGTFTRYLFRPSWTMVGVYIGLVFAYGYTFLAGKTSNMDEMESVRSALFGFGTASTLLHFYFDGFIWKVREKSTREGFGLKGGKTLYKTRPPIPDWVIHGLKWCLFVLPVGWLWYAEEIQEIRGGDRVLDRFRNIAESVPDSMTYAQLGLALAERGYADEADESFQRSLELDPLEYDALFGAGNLLLAQKKFDEAVTHFHQAIKSKPRSADAHTQLAVGLHSQGRPNDAIERYQIALSLNQNHPVAHFGLGLLLQKRGELDEAIEHYHAALRLKPDFVEARAALNGATHQKNRKRPFRSNSGT